MLQGRPSSQYLKGEGMVAEATLYQPCHEGLPKPGCDTSGPACAMVKEPRVSDCWGSMLTWNAPHSAQHEQQPRWQGARSQPFDHEVPIFFFSEDLQHGLAFRHFITIHFSGPEMYPNAESCLLGKGKQEAFHNPIWSISGTAATQQAQAM